LNEEAGVQLTLRDRSIDVSLCDFVDHLRPESSRGLIRLMVADKPLTWKTMKEFLCSHSSHARPSKTGHNIELGHLDLALSKAAYESEANLVSFTKKHKGRTALLLPVRVEIRVTETPLSARIAAVEGTEFPEAILQHLVNDVAPGKISHFNIELQPALPLACP